jgi:cytochrome c oxidase assembly protein subunit 15
VVGTLIWQAWRVSGVSFLARWLLVALLLQLVTGMSNVVLSWPLVAAVLHSGGAAVLVAVLVMFNFYAARARSR